MGPCKGPTLTPPPSPKTKIQTAAIQKYLLTVICGYFQIVNNISEFATLHTIHFEVEGTLL